MTGFVTTGRVVDGKLKVRNREMFEAWAHSQRNGAVIITIERAHATRSLEANALYWIGYVRPLSEYTGYTPNEMHAYLKARFFPSHKRRSKRLVLHNREGQVIDECDIDLSSTTTLTNVEFGDYLNDIREFAQSLKVEVGSNREAAANPQALEQLGVDTPTPVQQGVA